MITRRGWAVLAGSFALAGAGRAFGVLELFALAAGGVGLVGVALISVLIRRRFTLEAVRRLVPRRVHAGGDSRVELVVRNRGLRRTPVIALRDTVTKVRRDGTEGVAARQARFHLAPLEPGAADRAAYRLGADHRGLFRVGPLMASVTDAFGCVSIPSEIAPAIELTVFPQVEVVSPVPLTTGHDPRTGAGHPTFVGSGDEFFALRAYEVGDDLRRVHWPSTARRDDLMIRQHEVPWRGRASVLLDVRAAAHTEQTLEQAVSAAASLVTAGWQLDREVRLLTTDGFDSGFGSGAGHVHAMLEHLAVVEAGGDRSEALLSALRRRPAGALVVVTTTATTVPVLERVAAVPRGSGWLATVLFPVRPGHTRAVPPGVVAVRVDSGAFGEAWNRALAGPLATARSRR